MCVSNCNGAKPTLKNFLNLKCSKLFNKKK